jgi:hypothetical protein
LLAAGHVREDSEQGILALVTWNKMDSSNKAEAGHVGNLIEVAP